MTQGQVQYLVSLGSKVQDGQVDAKDAELMCDCENGNVLLSFLFARLPVGNPCVTQPCPAVLYRSPVLCDEL